MSNGHATPSSNRSAAQARDVCSLDRCVLLFSASLAFGAPGGASVARADTPPYATTWSQEATQGVAQASESPELRALRLAEEELFGRGPDAEPDTYDPDCVYGAPDALTSEVPKELSERASGRASDLGFLSDLKLPSLPVRWDSRVIEYLLFFKDDPRGRTLAAAWLKRSERYGPMIRRVLREHSLPEDLQFVAMIESGYDPLARSAAGALGMWQFVKPSGQFYGLRVDHWADERLDPERATSAAARYLRDLYERFGSWDLSFAAYNMGYGGLLRAVRKYNTNDYWLLSHLEAGLPFETSIYVAKITAMAVVANNPERFGFGDLAREPTLELQKIDVPAGTPLRPIAAAAGIDTEQLEALNPHLLRGRVPPGESPVPVYVPRAAYAQFAKAWSKSREPAQHVSYVVRFGETLEDVARRHDVSPARLRELNELTENAEVKAGFPLIVPATAAVKTLNGEQLVATVPDTNFLYENRRRVFYRVGSRDTPEAVARFFDVTVDELITWNNITDTAALQRDMLLQLFVRPDLDLGRAVVFTPEQVRILSVGTDEFFDFHETQRGRVRVRYRVQPNDTVEKIAKRFELSAGSVGRINQFASNKELKVDDWVVVYVPEKQIPELERKKLIERVGEQRASGPRAPSAEPPRTAAVPPRRAVAPEGDPEPEGEALPPAPTPADEVADEADALDREDDRLGPGEPLSHDEREAPPVAPVEDEPDSDAP